MNSISAATRSPAVHGHARLRLAAAAAGLYLAGVAAHFWALRLPYYWDEAGYFVPAALDLFRHGWWVPRSTLANGHPPLVMAALALAWRLAGYHFWVTRGLMLGFYAALIGGSWRLAHTLFGRRAAGFAALLAACAPLVFAQAPLAQLDLPAAAFVIWALEGRYRGRPWLYAAFAAAACLAKETAVLLPFSLALADLARAARVPKQKHAPPTPERGWPRQMLAAVWLHVSTLLPLLGWLAYYHAATGYWFGNAGFLAYNLGFSWKRLLLSLLRRLWQLFVYNGAWLAMGLGIWGWRRRSRAPHATPEFPSPGGPRPAAEFCLLVAIYLLFHAAVGGAVLARYLLPAEAALLVLLGAGLSWLPRPQLALAACVVLFVGNWFWRAPYPYPYEDNLAYVNFIELQQQAANQLESLPTRLQPVLTAWPATNELTTPALGYVRHPLQVAAVDNFNPRHLAKLPPFHSALLYSRQYQPPQPNLPWWRAWRRWVEHAFNYQPMLGRRALLRRLRLRVIWQARRQGQWALIAVPR